MPFGALTLTPVVGASYTHVELGRFAETGSLLDLRSGGSGFYRGRVWAGLKAETAVIGFDLEGIAVSSGSACSSGKVQPSHVLSAMGYDATVAQGAVRLSLGWSTAPEDINRALEAWRKLGNTLLRA